MTRLVVNLFSLRRTLILFATLLLLFLTTICCQGKTNSAGLFPHYQTIASNVSFWEKIYSHYSLNEAVIHDSKDLSKIYDVIPLLDKDLPGATRFNKIFQKHAKEKYQKLLEKIATDTPRSRDEKRVAALFTGKNRITEIVIAIENVRTQRGQKERFRDGVIHSGKYMKEIKRIFRAYQLPEELAYLPHVESSFNYRAYSKYGAAGIWQFTRGTGKQYLNINHSLDERLDPILASHAAARYLKNSYRSLNNWPLALTSYNYGLAGMNRAVQEQGNFVNIFNNYNKGRFKFASKNFYAEFLAALKVAKQLEKDLLDTLDQPLSIRYLELKGYVHINQIRRHFGLSLETIETLNPALRSAVLRGETLLPKGYTLRIPAEKKTNRLLATLPSSFYVTHQLKSTFHRVKEGDTAGSIARQYGVSLKSLIQANKLNKYATVFLNQKLKIPNTTSESGKNSQENSGLKQKISKAKILSAEPPTLLATKKRRPSGNGYSYLPHKDFTVYNVFNVYQKNGQPYGYITVQPAESLGLYEEWLGIQKNSIASLNNIDPKLSLTPGQQLLLPFSQMVPILFEEKRLDFLQETEEDFFSTFIIIGQKIYQVISGDTLWDISYNKFKVPLWLLERYNQTISLTQLDRKQQLVIPIVQPI